MRIDPIDETIREQLRLYMRSDTKFTEAVEDDDFDFDSFSEEELDRALRHAASDWSSAPPPLGAVTVATHPHPHLMIMCAAIQLATSDSFKSSRNPTSFSDGNLSVSEVSKVGNYNVAIGYLRADYTQQRDAIKVNQNIMGGFGGVPSDYSYGYGYG